MKGNKMKSLKISILVASMFVSVAANATGCGNGGPCSPISVTPTPVTNAAICNQVRSSATVNGLGTSLSHAAGSALAQSVGTQTNTNGTLNLTGTTQAANSGVAYNVSTGTGTGTASSTGTANSSLVNSATANGAHLQGTSNSTSSVNVVAGQNQGGVAEASTVGTFTATGNSTQVSDTKSTTSTANTGVVMNGNVALSQASTLNAAASSVVNVSGSLVRNTR